MARVDVLSADEWLAVAKTRLRDDGVDGDVQLLGVEPASDGGPAGFIAESLQVRVVVRVGESKRPLRFFTKTVPLSPSRARTGTESNAFHKEAGLYGTIAPRMRGLRPAAAADERPWAPRAYVARDELLVLDDLTADGFVTLDPQHALDFDHCVVVLRALAAFHADSLALEESESRSLGELHADLLHEAFYTEEQDWQGARFYRSAVGALTFAAGLLPAYRAPETLETVRKKLPAVLRKICEYVRASKHRRNVVCHGDLWLSNMLFKYDDAGLPEEVRLVDFQLMRYVPPAFDVMAFLYLTTRRALREARTADLLAAYHAALGRALARRGCDVQRLLPWEEFAATCNEYRLGGLLLALFINHFVLMPRELMKNWIHPDRYEEFFTGNRDRELTESFEKDPVYRQVLEEELSELIEETVLSPPAVL